MITFDEIVSSLQAKIQQYRKGQKVVFLLSNYLKDSKQQFSGQKDNVSLNIQKQIWELKQEATERVTAVAAFAQNIIEKQKNVYEGQIQELRTQISRQYKVITLMRQELEDLMSMLNERKLDDNSRGERENQEGRGEGSEQKNSEEPEQIINGLEVIEEEEDTDRTVMSSVHSCTQEGKFNNSDKFIKIQERQIDDPSEHQDFNDPSSNLPTQEREWHLSQNSSDQWTNNCKCYESQASRRQGIYLGELHTEQLASQWQSMPLSAQDADFGRGNQSWQGGASLKELREITNQNQKERQTKTKMFLEQFRKTFNKCLSSANVSRKSSKTNLSKPPKDKSKTMTTTFGKIEAEMPSNEKLITQMLRDIDNNHKFAVGSRRSELKYEGEKKEGLRSGQGVLYYSNGLSYEGEFKNNLRHGYGVLRFNQIEIYRGEWANDELTGQGKIRNFAVINKRKSASSSSVLNRWVSYCGSFRGNRFEGEGTLYLQGGQKFLGRFICGSACGEGTLYRKSGQVDSGVWRHNQLVQQF